MKIGVLGIFVLLGLWSCRVQKGIDISLLYGEWNVESIKTMDREMSGQTLGLPAYKFSKDGKRTHTLKSIAKASAKVVKYEVSDSTIIYPENPKLPSVRIVRLTRDTLVLENAKVKWILFK
jgi:hypothetical protein